MYNESKFISTRFNGVVVDPIEAPHHPEIYSAS